MNSTNLQMLSFDRFYSDQEFITSTYIIGYVMLSIAFGGVVTNILNIRTFICMGLDDGVTVSLMGLAMSDFGFSGSCCVIGISLILSIHEESYGLDNLLIQPRPLVEAFAGNISFMFYEITCLITTFIAVARCMCVALPFTFKLFFSRTRSIVVLVLFTLIAFATYGPVLGHMESQRYFDPSVNRTRFVLWISSKRSAIKDVVAFIHFVIIVFVSSLVVTVCIIVMAKNLMQSAKFRQKSQNEVTEKSGYKLSGKELQVVKQVIVICIIYTLSMIPTIFLSIYRFVEEEFAIGKRLNNLYWTISEIVLTMQVFNSASTFFVYYVYNSKFRSMAFCMQKNLDHQNH